MKFEIEDFAKKPVKDKEKIENIFRLLGKSFLVKKGSAESIVEEVGCTCHSQELKQFTRWLVKG